MKVASSAFAPLQADFKRLSGAKPKILLVADEDHTRIPWAENAYRTEFHTGYLEANRQAFHHVSPRGIIIGATGLDFKTLQWTQENLGVLTGFPPTDVEITDNGLEIRVNEDGLSHEVWLDISKDIPPHKDYESYIRSEVGYRREAFYQAMKTKIQEFGYTQIKDVDDYPPMVFPNCAVFQKTTDFPSIVVISYGESALYIIKEDGDLDYVPYTKQLAENITHEYARLTGKKVKTEVSDHGFYDYIFFSPDNGIDVSKETALNEALKLFTDEDLSNLLAAIACGDSRNDKHVIPDTLNLGNRTIDRFSVVTGRDLLEEAWFRAHSRLISLPDEKGHIGPGIMRAVTNL